MKYFLPTLIILTSCNPTSGYEGYFDSVTFYNISGPSEISPGGIKIFKNNNDIDVKELDKLVDELEECLGIPIEREWFVVYIPNDWYVSECSGEQVIPSKVDYRLCEAKGLEIGEECRDLMYPTEECPCVCNVRSEVQENGEIDAIVSAPNLKLFKTSLARIVLYPDYVFDNPDYTKCIW